MKIFNRRLNLLIIMKNPLLPNKSMGGIKSNLQSQLLRFIRFLCVYFWLNLLLKISSILHFHLLSL